jgi:hypothetical protein
MRISTGMASVVVLQKNGELRSAKWRDVAFSAVQKNLKLGEPVTVLAKFDYADDGKLLILGSQSGEAGQENKHELPPPIDNVLLFGDAVAIATEAGDLQHPLNLTIASYKKWLTDAFKGFEEIDSSESECAWASSSDSDEEEEEEEEEDPEAEDDSEGEFNDAAIGAEPDDEDEDEAVEVVAKPKPVARRRSSASLAKQIDYSQYRELEPEPYTYSTA